MNNRAVTISLSMAFFALYFVYSYVTSVEEEATKKFGTQVLVLVAKRDIKEMDTINETMLEFQTIPKQFVEPAAIQLSTKDDAKKISTLKGLAGTIAVVPVKKSEQITYNKITEPNMRTGLAPQVAPQKRAISISVSEVNAVGKLIKPGDRVDVIAVVDAGGGKENKIAKTILQDVVILSTGKYVTNNVARVVEADSFSGKDRSRSLAEDFSFTTATIEVDPAQAQMMALLAGGDNTLVLSLRNNDDIDRVSLSPVMLSDILGADLAKVKGGVGKR